jgi:hypothetical protein
VPSAAAAAVAAVAVAAASSRRRPRAPRGGARRRTRRRRTRPPPANPPSRPPPSPPPIPQPSPPPSLPLAYPRPTQTCRPPRPGSPTLEPAKSYLIALYRKISMYSLYSGLYTYTADIQDKIRLLGFTTLHDTRRYAILSDALASAASSGRRRERARSQRISSSKGEQSAGRAVPSPRWPGYPPRACPRAPPQLPVLPCLFTNPPPSAPHRSPTTVNHGRGDRDVRLPG